MVPTNIHTLVRLCGLILVFEEKTGRNDKIATKANNNTPAEAPRNPNRMAAHAIIGKIASSIG